MYVKETATQIIHFKIVVKLVEVNNEILTANSYLNFLVYFVRITHISIVYLRARL